MKKTRRITSIISFLIMLFMLLSGTFMGNLNSKATTTIPTTWETAQELVLGKTYNQSWQAPDIYGFNKLWYKVTLPSSGKLDVTLIHYGRDDLFINGGTIMYVYADGSNGPDTSLYMQKGNHVAFNYSDRTIKSEGYYNKGTYWICIYSGDPVTNMNVSYEISTSFKSSNVSFEESYTEKHNSPYSANSIKIDNTYVGQMSINDREDYYKFSVYKNGYIKLDIQIDLDGVVSSNNTQIYIKNDDASYTDEKSFTMSQNEKISQIFYLDAGTYYIYLSEQKYEANYIYNLKFSNINIGWVKNYDNTMSYYDAEGKLVKDEWINGEDGEIRYVNANGIMVTNQFVCDGTYTYFLQADGSPMRDRLTYHPDGVHVIYFDRYGHEVFSNFAHVKRSIAGDAVDDYCFFDVNGYLYVDVVTYDMAGEELYYANPYGVLERGKWFQFSDTVMCADGTPWAGAAGGYGYANSDGTLVTNTWVQDWEGRTCYLQGNGVALYP